jgi:hypothetical protein
MLPALLLEALKKLFDNVSINQSLRAKENSPAGAGNLPAPQICGGPEAGFQSSVPYTGILFFTVIASLRPEKSFRFSYRHFHRS